MSTSNRFNEFFNAFNVIFTVLIQVLLNTANERRIISYLIFHNQQY